MMLYIQGTTEGLGIYSPPFSPLPLSLVARVTLCYWWRTEKKASNMYILYTAIVWHLVYSLISLIPRLWFGDESLGMRLCSHLFLNKYRHVVKHLMKVLQTVQSKCHHALVRISLIPSFPYPSHHLQHEGLGVWEDGLEAEDVRGYG